MFGHLVAVDHLAGLEADLIGAGQPAAGHGRGDRGQRGLGGGQQRLAFAGSFGGQDRITAGDQPLAGVVGVADLSQVLLIEQ